MSIASAAQAASNTPAPAPATPVAQAPPVVENILNAPAHPVINGMPPPEYASHSVMSALYIIVTVLVALIMILLKLCLVWSSTLTTPPAEVGL